jgi:hypothetical protein
MAMSDSPRDLHEDTSNHHGYGQEEDDENDVYTVSRPLRHESTQTEVEEPPVPEINNAINQEEKNTPGTKLPENGTSTPASPDDATTKKEITSADGTTTTPLNMEAALSETGEGKEKEEKETEDKKEGEEKEVTPGKGDDKEAPAKEEAPVEITALGEGGELKLPEAELEPGSEEAGKKELVPVANGPLPPPPGDGEKLPGAEDGSRLTDMKVPALDGGAERMKLQDDTILTQTKESMKTFALESKTKEEQKITNLSKNEQKKENASTKLGKSKSAVEEKPSEKQSEVNSKQVTKVADVKPPDVKKDEAENKLHDTLNKSMPQTLEAVDEFKEKKVATDISAQVEGAVDGKTKEIDGTFSQIGKTEKPEDPKKGKPLGGIETPITTEGMNLGDNLVEPVKEDAVNLTAYKEESDNVLKREGISEEQLEQVTTGDLAEAKKLRTDLNEKADKGPADIRKEEQTLKEKNKAELNKEEQDKKANMRKERETGLHSSLEKQKGTKTAFERKKELVTNHINKIYEDANTKVKTKLDGLKLTAMAQFDGFQTMATATFENNVDSRIEEFKKERYDTVGGSFLWVKDKLFGIDDFPKVQEILRSERENYINSIDKAIVYITENSQKTIQETKTILADARKEIDKYVKSLGPELQKIGKEAQGDIQKKLDELDEKINKAAEELKESLAKKREDAIASIDKKIEEKRAEMSGGLAKMGGLLADAALKFFKWAVETAGYSMDDIMPIINKGKAVLTKIVTEPGQFFSDLGAGVGGGITNFMTNAGTHLKSGLFDWLTGAMSGIPIVLPEKWDLGGIFSFISQILGFGWETIKGKFAKFAGIDEEKMSQIETAISKGEEGMDEVKKVKEQGLAGAVDIAKDQVEEAKATAMSSISDWAFMAIVKAAVPRVIAMLNPAGAIAQLIVAMVKAVIWFKDNFDRIAKWVKTVFDSVVDIAGGAIGAAAQKVEQSMAQAIPMILGFLAEQLGLGGIGKAIQEVMEKIRKPVDKIVDKIVNWIVTKAKKLIEKIKKALGKNKKPEDQDGSTNNATEEPDNTGIIDGKADWGGVDHFTSEDGGKHELYYKEQGNDHKLMVASDRPTEVKSNLKEDRTIAQKENDTKELKDIQTADQFYESRIIPVENEILGLEQKFDKAKTKEEKARIDRDIKIEERKLRKAKKELADKFTEIKLSHTGNDRPEIKTQINHKPGPFGPTEVIADPLTWLPGNTVGSSPSEYCLGWKYANEEENGVENPRKGIYVRGHMVNDHLHGPGVAWNMVPITRVMNSEMEHDAESVAKTLIKDKTKVIYYKTEVKGYYSETGNKNDENFPSNILVTWGEYEYKEGKRTGNILNKDSKSFRQGIPASPFNINDLGPTNLVSKLKLSEKFSNIINEMRKERIFKDEDDFEGRMEVYLLAHPENNSIVTNGLNKIRPQYDNDVIFG